METVLPDSDFTVHTVTMTPISFYMDCDWSRDRTGEELEWNPIGYCMEDGTTEPFRWELPPEKGYKKSGAGELGGYSLRNPAGLQEDLRNRRNQRCSLLQGEWREKGIF